MTRYAVQAHTGSVLTFEANSEVEFLNAIGHHLGERAAFPLAVYKRFYQLGVTEIVTESGQLLFHAVRVGTAPGPQPSPRPSPPGE